MEQRDKVGFVKESCDTNGGKRSVLQGVFAPGASAPAHYHTAFDESFEILEGELSVWDSGKKMILRPGDRATIKKRVIHRFKNESGHSVQAVVTIEPGYKPFEQNMRIMMGLQKDGLVEQLSRMTPKMVPVGMILTDLSDTHLVGAVGFMLNVISRFYSKSTIDRRKKELLDKYCA